jgi:hypothetical protein
MMTINWSKFKSERGAALFLVDLLMLNLVVINLLYILVEWNFNIDFVNEFLKLQLPAFHSWYNTHLHRNFYRYDLIFVAIFITEFCLRWALAVYHKKHHKWFFYPFLHWYDVIGCVPVASFRFLRILRFGSMIWRLHKMEVIDLHQSSLFAIFERYRAMIVEEISDRVVVNVLSGVQEELKHGTPVVSRIILEVYQEQLRAYVNRKVAEAVRSNSEVRDIANIPLVGSTITGKLEKAVAEITFAVIEGMMQDMSSEENSKVISELADVTMDMMLLQEEDEELNRMSIEMINKSIDIIKQQVEVKRWQEEG